jgi:tetratricopeptide (TPR) repeat protein
MLFQKSNLVLKILPFLVLLPIMVWSATAAKSFLVIQSQASDPQPPLQILEHGKTVEREIKGGESHTYQVALSAGQYLHTVVKQNGIELSVALFGPGNNQLIDIKGWNLFVGTAPLYWISTEAGSYTIRVYSSKKEARDGKYQINIEEIRTTTDVDSLRVSAQAAFAEAYELNLEESKGSKEKAIEKYLEAISKYKTVADHNAEARTLNFLGNVHYSLGELRKALENFNQALLLHKQVGNRSGESQTLSNIGLAYNALKEKQKALDYYKEALPLCREVGDRVGEAITLNGTGLVYYDLGEKQKALDYYNQALLLHKQVGDRNGEATALKNIGSVYYDLGEKQKTLDYYNQSLSLFKQIGNRSGEANALNNIGVVYDSLGEKQKALDYYNQALLLRKQLGDRNGEANTLNNIGLVYDNLGEKQKALDYCNQALLLHKQVGNRSAEAAILNNIGVVYNSLGEKQKALDYYNQALPLRKQVGDRNGIASTLNNIGVVYNSFGEKQKALDYYNQALPLYKQVGNRFGEAQILHNIGEVYNSLGEEQKALDYYNQALPLRRQVGNRSGEALTLINIGEVYWFLGEKQKALDYYNQALPLHKQVGNRFGEAATLNNIGSVYDDLGEKQKALDYYNQALPLYKQVGSRSGEANALNNIGEVYNSLGEKQKALDYYNQALLLHKQLGDRFGEASTLFNISKLEAEQDNFTSARANIENAIKLIEFIRTNVAGQDLRSSFFATKRNYYELYIDHLMRMHKASPKDGFDSLALQASEQSRARSLVELLTEANIDIREGVDTILLEREKSLRQLINDKAERLLGLKGRKNTEEQIAQLEKEISILISESKEVENRIRSSSPKYAALTKPEAVSLKDIQQLLDPDTLLLEYSLGKDRSYLWLASQTSLTSYELPSRKQIEDKAREFYNLLTSPASGGEINKDYQKIAFEMGKTLLGPAQAELGKKRLLVIAEGALQYTPFAALSLQADVYSPLILEHEIANITSISTLAVQMRELANRPDALKLLAVIADPVFELDDHRIKLSLAQRKEAEQRPSNELEQSVLLRSAEAIETLRDGGFGRLLGSRREANSIALLAQKEQVLKALDFDASKEIATSEELSKYRYIHIATHGLINSKNPELSGVVLSLVDKEGRQQSGFLKLNEIYNLKLNAELVVLSGCQTGLGKEIRGEGLVGLTRGFMYSGAKSVVASLWSVQDFTTSELMANFYQVMLKGGKRPAEALRQAQIDMFKKGNRSHPYYWASFTFQGDWREENHKVTKKR